MPGVHIDNVGEGTMLQPGNISTSPVVLTLPSSCF
jgi:hypothetical protein